ncbi:TetR/AcrR family transcriptional regulator [Geodermatophilus sabuli]|uniref:TetR/AcrR family transcriptional regulator n=1 Tax=Geodermatophilus sabuli TaxID=1564158 RepID=A0A7K3W546_9ACTN|nr:TetR/AcrR family transcriptional regulator [Geodermatophilus sabuli]
MVRVPLRTPGRGTAAPDRDRTEDPRVLRSRAAIVEAATGLFLERGYVDTSVDDIAARAAVSKRTVYNNFTDKERLFTDIVLGVTATAERFAAELAAALADVDDVSGALHDLAREHLASVTRPQVVRLRRLISAESGRFPDLAREYHRRAPERVIVALAGALAGLGGRGLLRVPDPRRAAEHLAFLVVGATLDRVMFEGEAAVPPAAELEALARDGVEVFLSAYTPA